MESSGSSSMIQMSVVDTGQHGPGVRRSSVVMIEHLAGDQETLEQGEEIQTHIFV